MLVNLSVPVIQPNVISVMPVVLVNSLNHSVLVNVSVPVIQTNIMSVTPVVLVNSLSHYVSKTVCSSNAPECNVC